MSFVKLDLERRSSDAFAARYPYKVVGFLVRGSRVNLFSFQFVLIEIWIPAGILPSKLGNIEIPLFCDRKTYHSYLTVRGTQALVSFAPLAFKLFCAARQDAVLRRSPFPPV